MTFMFLWAIWALVSYFVVQIVSYERVSDGDRNKKIEIKGILFKKKVLFNVEDSTIIRIILPLVDIKSHSNY